RVFGSCFLCNVFQIQIKVFVCVCVCVCLTYLVDLSQSINNMQNVTIKISQTTQTSLT
ncbi:hypothetical protein PO909_023132, partial [Leuciscus waleckii]